MSMHWSIDHRAEVSSTQDLIKALARAGSAEGAGVQADVQTGGYGRHGRQWVSESGNFYLSLLLRPACHIQKVPQLSLVTSLAIGQTMINLLEGAAPVVLKWPNDVLLGNGKGAGILLETEALRSGMVDWVALGTGINISTAPSELGRALNDFLESPVGVDQFRDAYLERLEHYYTRWKSGGFADIRQAWLDQSYEKGARVQVKIGANVEKGYFEGLDESGNLIVRDGESVLKTISAGEAHFNLPA